MWNECLLYTHDEYIYAIKIDKNNKKYILHLHSTLDILHSESLLCHIKFLEKTFTDGYGLFGKIKIDNIVEKTCKVHLIIDDICDTIFKFNILSIDKIARK
jgi:hypothetical protein